MVVSTKRTSTRLSSGKARTNRNRRPEILDITLQTTHVWLKDIVEEIGPDSHRAYHVLRAVLHALRDQLTIELSAHLSAQLPILIRGIFFEQWRPAKQPDKVRSSEEFLKIVGKELENIGPINHEDAARAVFKTLTHYLEPNEIKKVRQALPKHIRELWQ